MSPSTPLNCTAQEGPISADADIVGLGVTAAFLVSSLLTVFAVFAAYLSGSLGDEHMSHLDRFIIKWARLRGRSVKSWLGSIFRDSRNPPPPEGNLDNVDLPPRSQAWKHGVSRFILALSDQQLVTGFAILVSGIVRQKDLTVWEFQVVLSLAWFSTTSHLATLDALRTYLKAQPLIRHVRVSAMIVVLILLIYTFSVSWLGTNYPVAGAAYPIQCVFDQPLANEVPSGSSITVTAWVIPLVIVVLGYYTRISKLYWGDWIMFSIMRLLNRTSPQPWLLPEDGVKAQKASGRFRVLKSWPPALWTEELNRLPAAVRVAVVLAGPSIFFVVESFFGSLSVVLFSITYSISQLYTVRWGSESLLTKEESSMGFGQIMAICFLALPPLAAVESYYDYKEHRTKPIAAPPTISDPAITSLVGLEITDTADADTIHATYDHYREDIIRYLAFDVALLDHLASNPDTDLQDIVERKKKMLIQCRQLKEIEFSTPLHGALGLILFIFISSAFLGIVLNLWHDQIGVLLLMVFIGQFSSITFFLSVGFQYVLLWKTGFHSIFKEGDSITTEENAAAASSGGTPGESDPSVELAELDTSRRTRTGLIEEGRVQQGVEVSDGGS
ncbi:hypothetical protein QBC39DRAFT_350374 [Podospora conica]|nr:hypothetical protein QBC39DRAFT_350374 [Schizothecium conicum]